MKHRLEPFKFGLRDGIPIALGYLAVSFSFGIMAKGAGIGTLEAAVMSFTNLTSAGQFAALGIIQSGAPLLEMAATQLIINLRYCLMSCSLSQKLSGNMPFFHRFLMAYGVTDEIFGVSVCREGVLSPFYTYGLLCAAVPGWTLGTVLGAVSGDLLPGECTAPAGVRAVTNLLLPLSREGDVRIYSARELAELLSTAFHGAECRRAGPTALVAWGVK